MSSDLVAGFLRLKNCKAGQLIRLQSGEFVALTQYHSFNGGKSKVWDGYILGTGEAFHPTNSEEWVAVIDTEWIHVEIEENEEYPSQPPLTFPSEAILDESDNQ